MVTTVLQFIIMSFVDVHAKSLWKIHRKVQAPPLYIRDTSHGRPQLLHGSADGHLLQSTINQASEYNLVPSDMILNLKSRLLNQKSISRTLIDMDSMNNCLLLVYKHQGKNRGTS